jgi:hypothetical protein
VSLALVSFQSGHPTAERSLEVVGLVLLVGAVAVLAMVLGSEFVARRAGDLGAPLVSSLFRVVGRGPVEG